MIASPLAFYLFAGLAIACSLTVILKKSPVSSAFSLILVFFAFAGIYALLDAHLIATLQILVYAGAIMVLFVFVIMLLNADSPSLDMVRTHKGVRIAAFVLGIAFLATMITLFQKWSGAIVARGAFSPEAIETAGGNTRVVSRLMFSEYVLPVELTSVLLLAAIVGAVALAKRRQS